MTAPPPPVDRPTTRGMNLRQATAWHHYDRVRDSGHAYTQFHGWVLTCSHCEIEVRGDTKAEAVRRMQAHYDYVSNGTEFKVIVAAAARGVSE